LPVQLLALGALDDDCVYQFCVEIETGSVASLKQLKFYDSSDGDLQYVVI
jgi:hypothetical protein